VRERIVAMHDAGGKAVPGGEPRRWLPGQLEAQIDRFVDDGGWRTAALHQPASVDGLLKIVATPFLAAGSWSSM